jgi:CheY-like chemotaxis protein
MRRTLLVIDDDRDIRQVAKTSLELVGGFHVILADSGQRGLTLAHEARPDAIILDLMMPDLDGRTTLAHLKQTPEMASIPVIMLTAKVQVNRQELVGQGAAGVLVKPFDPMQLPDQVCEILGWRSSRKDKNRSDAAEE